MTCRNDQMTSKPGLRTCLGRILAGGCRLARRSPAGRWGEVGLGAGGERGDLVAETGDGTEVWMCTSAIYSPGVEKNIWVAWVPTQYASLGTSLGVSSEWGDRNGVVVEMPFVDPKKQIPLS